MNTQPENKKVIVTMSNAVLDNDVIPIGVNGSLIGITPSLSGFNIMQNSVYCLSSVKPL